MEKDGFVTQPAEGSSCMNDNIPARVYRDIVTFAQRNNIQKVILFGSRARGTHAERSDVDLAVQGGDFDSFYWEIKEKAHTLLSFDVINMNEKISEDLKREIERDGVVLYEKD